MSATATNAMCQACGKELEGRSDKRFCSDACRKRAARAVRPDIITDTPEHPYTCTRCAQDISADGVSRECKPGLKHVAAAKTYLLADAPQQSGRNESGPLPKTGRTLISNVPPPTWELGEDQHDGGTVVFENGRYATTDPVEQYYLDLRGSFCSEQEWEAAWLSADERERRRVEARERELAELQREIELLKGGLVSPGGSY